MLRPKTLADLAAAAKKFGGKSLAREYKNMHAPVPWMCKKGHTWDAPFEYIVSGCWCPQCYRDEKRRGWLERTYAFVQKRGGKILSGEPQRSADKIKVRCTRKHEFISSAHKMKDGYWCPQCAIEQVQERALMRLQNIAKKRGGKCLTKKYPGSSGMTKWQCAKGHTWSFRAHSITFSWCPHCSQEAEHEKRLKSYREYAKKKGGICLSSKFKNGDDKLWWECIKGHQWLSAPHSMLSSGSWCPTCGAEQRRISRRRHTIAAIQKEARKRGGKLLSKVYTSTEQKLHWECAKKHRWYAQWNAVHYSGTWCLQCYRARRKRDKLGRYA